MISVRAKVFLSLFSKSSVLCGPFGSLQRVQEDQRYFQVARLHSCVSLHLLDKCTHYILDWGRKRHPCWLCCVVFPSFCGLIQFQGEVRKKILSQLLMLLCHSFPVVSSQDGDTPPPLIDVLKNISFMDTLQMPVKCVFSLLKLPVILLYCVVVFSHVSGVALEIQA